MNEKETDMKKKNGLVSAILPMDAATPKRELLQKFHAASWWGGLLCFATTVIGILVGSPQLIMVGCAGQLLITSWELSLIATMIYPYAKL